MYKNSDPFNLSNPLKVFLVFCAIGFAAYFHTISYSFVHDDVFFIKNNPGIGNIGISVFLPSTVPVNAQEQGGIVNVYYRPLLDIYNGLVYKMFGANPHVFHAINIFIHVLNAFLLFSILLKLVENKHISFAISTFFLLHPVQAEAVTIISGISNLLYSFFALFSINIFLIYRRMKVIIMRPFILLLSVFLFLAGVFAKEQIVTLPFVIFAINMYVCKKQESPNIIKNSIKHSFPYFFALAGYFYFRSLVLGGVLALNSIFNNELGLRVLSIPATLLTYWRTIFFPNDLHYYRNADILLPFFIPLVLLSAIVAVVVLLLRYFRKEDRDLAMLGIFWFFLFILPVLNLVSIVNEYSFIMTAEHFLYLPVIGIFIFIFAFYSFLGEKIKFLKGRFSVVLFLVLVIVCGYITIKQTLYYKNEIVLFERTLQYEENFGRAHILLADAYAKEGRKKDAIEEYKKAADIINSYIKKTKDNEAKTVYYMFLSQAYNGIGLNYLVSDKRSALKYFSKAQASNCARYKIISGGKECYQ